MIVFVTNFLNHHQFPLAKELYELTRGEFRFVELMRMPDAFKKSGYPEYESTSMLIKAWESPKNKEDANHLILDADVVLYGYLEDDAIIYQRLNRNKLTFEVGERWLKQGFFNLFSPRLIKSQIKYHFFYHDKPLYRLNASAYASADMQLMHSFNNKCFKWGYFTEINDLNSELIIEQRRDIHKIKFISIGRLIKWKRHDLIIKAAKILKQKDYKFEVNIYGSGGEESNLMRMIMNYDLEDRIFLKGNKENSFLLNELRCHHACIFPSNRREGWGAVVNEAMSNACPVIGSHLVGAVPYLIKDNQNGLVFRSGDHKDLAQKMEMIINDSNLRESLSINAYNTMRNVWSPKCAARNLLNLVDAILYGKDKIPIEGPCSRC